jgi:hypothetical protein
MVDPFHDVAAVHVATEIHIGRFGKKTQRDIGVGSLIHGQGGLSFALSLAAPAAQAKL